MIGTRLTFRRLEVVQYRLQQWQFQHFERGNFNFQHPEFEGASETQQGLVEIDRHVELILECLAEQRLGKCIDAFKAGHGLVESGLGDKGCHDPVFQGLLLINSLGSAMSPLMISPVMTSLGEAGLFWAFAVVNLCMVTFFVWRRGKRPVPVNPAPFTASATFSPTGAELRLTEDLMQAAQDHPLMPDAVNGQTLAIDGGMLARM